MEDWLPRREDWLAIVALALGYAALAFVGSLVAIPPGNITAVFPPSGLALGALLVGGRRLWPGVFLGALPANFLPMEYAPDQTSAALFAATAISLGSVVQAWAGQGALTRWAGGRHLFESPHTVARFVGIEAVVCLLSPTIGVSALAIAGMIPASAGPATWLTFWLGDLAGVYLMVPLMVGSRLSGARLKGFGRVEPWLIALALLVTAELAYGRPFEWLSPVAGRIAFAPFPPLVWAAFRLNTRVVAVAVATLYSLALWATASGSGPFAQLTSDQQLLVLDLHLAALSFTALFLAAAAAERREAERLLGQQSRVLEERVQERTSALQEANRELHAQMEERQRMMTELARAQQMQSVGRLAGGIAHDFNNLLTAILGHVDLLGSDRTSPKDTESIEAIEAAARSAADLTGELLAFAGRRPSAPQAVDVERAVKQQLKLAAPLLGPNIDVALDLPEGLWPAKIDPGHLNQVMMNIIVNARDAMEGSGKLVVRVRNIPAAQSALERDCLRIEFQDNGPGIESAVLAQLFEPFFTTKSAGRGTGLGLAVCYGLLERADGTIDVDTAIGQGSTFSLLVPRHSSASVESTRPSPARNTSKPAVLLYVEDNSAIRRLGNRTLTDAGYVVHTAEDGEEALRVGSAKPFDVLITDLNMPNMSGRELISEFRRKRPKLPVVIVSGHLAEHFPRGSQHRREEHTSFLPKPYNNQQLLEAVASAVRTISTTSGELVVASDSGSPL